MKRKIPCFCENTFEAEIPEEINLDNEPGYLDEILNGNFLAFRCPNCGKKHKPEFPLSVHWPSKKLSFEILPELDRGVLYRRKKRASRKGPNTLETIIGYAEMAERLAVLRDGYEPVAVEAIKYFLHLKAEEQYPEKEMEILYYKTERASEQNFLEFHIHGIKENEVAVMKIPFSLYEKTIDDYKKHPKSEIYSSLRVQTYLSVKNTMRN